LQRPIALRTQETAPGGRVWLHEGNPIVGYSRQKPGVRLYTGYAEGSALLFDSEGAPYKLGYEIAWTSEWKIRDLRIVTSRGSIRSEFRLSTDGSGAWRDPSGSSRPEFAGCRDVDIWPTPFTNTFPVRRLNLDVRDRAEFRVVYVEAPELHVSVRGQSYTRLTDDRYLFESLDDDFKVELEVDRDGFVIDYPGLFRRLV
jgi:hypothetical protein